MHGSGRFFLDQQFLFNELLTRSQWWAQIINERPQVIQEYESGKAIPSGQILNKLSRALGVTLKKNPTKK